MVIGYDLFQPESQTGGDNGFRQTMVIVVNPFIDSIRPGRMWLFFRTPSFFHAEGSLGVYSKSNLV